MKDLAKSPGESGLHGPSAGSFAFAQDGTKGAINSSIKLWEHIKSILTSHPSLGRREMHETRGMWEAMTAVGYKENTKMLTRGQVKVIVRFLGEP